MAEKPQPKNDLITAFEWAGDRSVEELDFQAKRDHGGAAFWVFTVTSPFLFWLARPRPTGWMVLLFCLGGAFAIPIASIATFFIRMKLAARITPQQAIALQIPWFMFDSGYSILVTWLLFTLLAKL